MVSDSILSVKNLNIAYDTAENLVVKDFNLSLEEKKVVAIVGESGCGKTSLIRAIMGILPPTGMITQGEILFDSISLVNNKKYKRGKEISFVFQHSGAMLNPVFTIGHQFMEMIRAHQKMSKAEAKILAMDSLKKVKLEDVERIFHSYPFELSGGMQQRVGIAMAITFKPKLLLADEPTSALDVTAQLQILDLLKGLNEEFGTSILFVTHNLGAAAYLAENCLVMYQGEVVEEDSMNQVISQAKHPYTQKLIQSSRLENNTYE